VPSFDLKELKCWFRREWVNQGYYVDIRPTCSKHDLLSGKSHDSWWWYFLDHLLNNWVQIEIYSLLCFKVITMI